MAGADDKKTERRVRVPFAPAVIAGPRGIVWLTPDGEVETLSLDETPGRIKAFGPPLVCHGRAFAGRLGMAAIAAFDVLELFAFVHPARFCLPTPGGLAEDTGLAIPTSREREAETLFAATGVLLERLGDLEGAALRRAIAIAWVMEQGGWIWGRTVLDALGAAGEAPRSRKLRDGLRVWQHLPEWEDGPPMAAPGNQSVQAPESRERLKHLLGPTAETRDEQMEYAGAVSTAFAPREHEDEPRFVIAEAGTGVGKTLGYIAPASLWAERNGAAVWLSTFTRNLQRQMDGELDRLFPDPVEKEKKVVVRKGRENYFCLLNFDEAIRRLAFGGQRGGGDPGGRIDSGADTDSNAVALGLLARWALATRNGDMVGGDFPAWLVDILGRARTIDLTDTRGECIYSACDHYSRCYIERSIRDARRADLVVANHALVIIQAALTGSEFAEDDAGVPQHYVFDEGHHLFGAADSAFSADLSGIEAADLRRWLLGAEAGARSRSRGLKTRLGDLVDGNDDALRELDHALHAARALPKTGWRMRLADGKPDGAAEEFLASVRQQVYARNRHPSSYYGLETDTAEPVDGLRDAATALKEALADIRRPLARLMSLFGAVLDTEAAELDTQTRQRIQSIRRSIERRALGPLAAWRDMLQSLHSETPDGFVDWFSVERLQGRDFDIGLHRHWIDPMVPFIDTVVRPAHGVLVTSATLCDRDGRGGEDDQEGWAAADIRTGARNLKSPVIHTRHPSPFDYQGATRVLIVGDVDKRNPDHVAAAYRELFLAAGGGGLGLFTAINRLRHVHKRIAAPLDDAGIRLLAQHIDEMDTGTLIDVFRAEQDACLLGTDAVRDGIDVPGRSLRLIVFDRVPWPRPDILHKARRRAFGGAAYDEMLTRLKLQQAYGRLIRREGDRGMFVMLDARLPTRMLTAFPDGVKVQRIGLAEAVSETRAFLSDAE